MPDLMNKRAKIAALLKATSAQQTEQTDQKYTALRVIQTCDFAPSQWDVLCLPKPLYVRYRYGTLTVQEDNGSDLGDHLLRWTSEDQLDGTMSTEDMMERTKTLIDWSQCVDGSSCPKKRGAV